MKLVIVTYNRLDLLKRTVGAWLEQGVSDMFIVNNGSTIDTKQWLEQNKFKCIHLPNNIGIRAAMQLAFNGIADDWILFSDDDIVPVTNNFIRILEGVCTDQNRCIGAEIDNMDKRYEPKVLGREGQVRLTTHVSGCRAMSRKACKMLLHLERDLKRYEYWRAKGGRVGYLETLHAEHIGEGDGVVDRGFEYVF